MRQVIVEVSPTGEIKIEGQGFSGPSCEKCTAALEAALGVVKKKEKTKDWYVQTVGKVGAK